MEFIDAKNMQCPMPIVELAKASKRLKSGDQITIEAVDLAFEVDVRAWCKQTGHELNRFEQLDDFFRAVILIK